MHCQRTHMKHFNLYNHLCLIWLTAVENKDDYKSKVGALWTSILWGSAFQRVLRQAGGKNLCRYFSSQCLEYSNTCHELHMAHWLQINFRKNKDSFLSFNPFSAFCEPHFNFVFLSTGYNVKSIKKVFKILENKLLHWSKSKR